MAIVPIMEGTDLFPTDKSQLVWVNASQVKSLPPAIRQMYDDFCITKEGQFGCPDNFNNLTVAWYLNHSETPNVRVGDDYRFFALKNIEAGQELTVDYRTYSANRSDAFMTPNKS